jgi:SNF2 family DNA or RNA helicase
MAREAVTDLVGNPPRKKLAYIFDEVDFMEHQVEGVRKMATLSSFMLCDDMGLGKSLQAITVAAIDFERGWAKRVIVVCTATLKRNWAEELEKFTRFTYAILEGTPKQREAILDEFIENGTQYLIVNYEQVEKHLARLNEMLFDIVIVDEAHMIKNPKSARTKAVHKLDARRAFVLTGSPVLNRANELWGQLHRVNADEFPKFWPFVNRFSVFGGFNGREIVGVKDKEGLAEILDRYMIRRKKADVLNLPPKRYIDLPVDFHPYQKELYDQARDELQITVPSSPSPMDVENAMVKALRLKQICVTPATLGADDHSYKMDRAQELVVELCGAPDPAKVVVFTQFREAQAVFLRRLEKLAVPTWMINGDIAAGDRVGVIRSWSDSKNVGALVCTIQSTGVGLNMVAAQDCIFLDKLYVPKLNEQAEDRLHRIGQDGSVTIYYPMVRGSIESRIERILKSKRKLFDDLVEDSEWKRALIEELRKQEDD